MKLLREVFLALILFVIFLTTRVKSQFFNNFNNFGPPFRRSTGGSEAWASANGAFASAGVNGAFASAGTNGAWTSTHNTNPFLGGQQNGFHSRPRPQFHGGSHKHRPHKPHSHHYRNFAPVFHDMEKKWEPEYNSSVEEEDMNDDFNGRSIVAPGEYPHMVAVGFRSSSDVDRRTEFKCGGSLISDMYVLTAAHCCSLNGEAPYLVKMGDINLKKREFELQPQRRFVADYYVHPEYNSTMNYHDIALLKLRNAVEYTYFVRPIRLWAADEIPYEKVFTMGYGSTSFAHAPTNILTELDLSIVAVDKCNSSFPVDESSPRGIIQSQICAKDFEKNRDTCQGDSGGPLQLNLERRRRKRKFKFYLVGIISYGDFCGSSHPGVYTRVSSYVDWIASIVWPQHYENFN